MKEKKTVFLGDSITRGYGVSSGEGWVELLHRGKNINHGIDGDTTAGMLRRFSAHVVREQPERVVIMGAVLSGHPDAAAEFGAAGGLDSRLCEGKWMAVLRFCP